MNKLLFQSKTENVIARKRTKRMKRSNLFVIERGFESLNHRIISVCGQAYRNYVIENATIFGNFEYLNHRIISAGG